MITICFSLVAPVGMRKKKNQMVHENWYSIKTLYFGFLRVLPLKKIQANPCTSQTNEIFFKKIERNKTQV